MTYKGDIAVATTLRGKFTTRRDTGLPTTLAGSPALSIYKDGSTTQSAAGVTLSVDFDGVTGLNQWEVDTSADGTFYSAGSDFAVVITAGTVNSVSVVGEVIGEFSIENRAALRPTVAGRTVDVTATGAVGIDWANVENPTTALNLSATNIDVDQVVASVSGAVGSVTGAVGSVTGAVGSVTGAVGSVTGNVGGNVTGTVGSVVGAVGSVTGNVGGNVVGTVASVVGAVGSVTGLTASDVGAIKAVTDKVETEIELDGGSPARYRFTTAALALAPTGGSAPTAAAIADAVWDEARAGHVAGGSFGEGVASVQGNVTGSAASVSGAVGSVSGNVGGNVVGTVGSVVGAVGSVTTGVVVTTNNDKTGYRLSATGVDDVWDEAIAGHLSAGSTGLALNDATSAGNPWSSTLEGTLTAGDMQRIIVAAAVGKTTVVAPGDGTATVTFRDASDLSDIIVGNTVGSERVSVTLTP